MLSSPADFPHTGSTAYLAPSGEAVRIQQRNADGTALISIAAFAGKACGNKTVELARLHATRDAAIASAAPRRKGRGK